MITMIQASIAASIDDHPGKSSDELARGMRRNRIRLNHLALYLPWVILMPLQVATGQDGMAILEEIKRHVDGDNYQPLDELFRKATFQAKSTRDVDLLANIQSAKKHTVKLEQLYKKLEETREKLEQYPKDGDANSEMGKYYCFAKEDWDRGLPLLARGSVQPLNLLARYDLKNPTGGDARKQLGAGWLTAAKDVSDSQDRSQMYLRARHWLLLALEQSSTDEERQTIHDLLGQVKLNPTKIVIFNTHNGPKNNRGTRLLDLTLLLDEKVVFRQRITMKWKPDVSVPNTIWLEGRTSFNTIKLDVLKWEGFGGGLAEIEVYQGKTNLAERALAVGNSSLVVRCRPASLTDGNRGNLTDQEGLWMLNNSTMGTVSVFLNRR